MPPRAALFCVLLLLGAALSYLIGNGSAPLLDRDEPRYAITSRNMLTTGNYVVPRQYDEARAAKPPMIYWLQATSMRFLGDTEFAARLPSSVAMLTLVALVLLFFLRQTDANTALLTATIFAFAGLTGFVAKMAITDANHTLLTAVILACTYLIYRGNRSWPVFLTLGVAGGLSLLTKGPIALMVAGTTCGALLLLALLDRKFPPKAHPSTFAYPHPSAPARLWPKVLVAVLLAVVIALPWAIAVNVQEPSFFVKMFKKEAIQRTSSLKGVDGQARPPGFYLLSVFGTFFPFSLLLPAALAVGWQNRHRPLTRFALAACIGPWLMFETVVSKMVHWFLPVFVPLAYLTADAVLRCWRDEHRDLVNKPFVVIAGLCSAGILALGVAAYPALHQLNDVPWWVETLLFAWAAFMGTVPFILLINKKFPAMVAASALGMAVLYPLIFAVLVPHLWFLDLPERLAADLRRLGATEPGQVLMVDYKEPSLAFYQGGTIREAVLKDLNDLTTRPNLRFAVLPKATWDKLGPDITSRWGIVSTQKGVAYASSRFPIDVHVLERK